MPALTAEEIVRDLARLGIGPGQDVLVHSSLSSLGRVENGARTVVEALVAAVSPGGTVCVPTITGSAKYSRLNPPRFAPSDPCWTGAIPEAFRRASGAVRSLHPTHSVACIGPRARELVLGHEHSLTPCGEESPYTRLARTGGRILFIGCTLESNTTLHGVEETAGLGYVCQAPLVEAQIALPEGGRTVRIRIHTHGCGPARDFGAIGPLLERAGALRRGKVGGADCILVESGPMAELVLERLREDPEFLLARDERGKGWPTASVDPAG